MFCTKALAGGRLHQTQCWDFWLRDKLLPHKALRKVSDNPAAVGWSLCREQLTLRAGGISVLGSSEADPAALAPCPAAGAEREAEPQRGSSGHEGGLLTGAAGSALSPLPLSWGTNKPGSPMLQLPPHSPRAARSHPHWALGSGRVQRSHQEGCGPRGSHARALAALKARWLRGAAIAVTASCSLRRKPAVCAPRALHAQPSPWAPYTAAH